MQGSGPPNCLVHAPQTGRPIWRVGPRTARGSASRATTRTAMPLTMHPLPGYKVLQVNLNHCWTAQQLLLQTVAELCIDVVIVSDYNRPLGQAQQWVASANNKCGIYIPNRSNIIVADLGSGEGFAWARVDSTLFYSCYCTPNCTIHEFDSFLGGLEGFIRHLSIAGMNAVVAGDFNSHSAEWGSSTDDLRGFLLSGFASALGLTVCNVGSVPTYRRVNASSVIDVTFALSVSNRPLVTDWTVLASRYTASDHEYVAYTVAEPEARRAAFSEVRPGGWSKKKLSLEAINSYWESTGPPPVLPQWAYAEEHAERLQNYLIEVCEAAMPRRCAPRARRAVHWWNEDIAILRRAAIAARRKFQRAGRKANAAGREAEFAVYNQARKDLRAEIRKAQERSWRELCDSVDNDPWGVPYKLVTKRLGRRSPALDNKAVSSIARDLFPYMQPVDWDQIPGGPTESTSLVERLETTDEPTPPFSHEELLLAAGRMPSGKAPGPDFIPNEIIKLAVRRSPEIFLSTFNACLQDRKFPRRWKRAKLVLIHKGAGKPMDQSSSYRPISLLDGCGKLLERLLLNRLEQHVQKVDALSDFQFGFRRCRSTTDALEEVLKTARAVGRGAVQNRHLCVVVTLDVKNAFNTAPWRLIDEAIRRTSAPEYMVGMIRSYMSDRKLLVGEDPFADGSSLPVTCGVPQGSVLGPMLWNLFYDGILRLSAHRDAKLVAFADDVAIVAVDHTVELLEQSVNPILLDVAQWMSANGLKLAPEKSECIVLTNKHAYSNPQLCIQGFRIPVKRSLRYLGVHLDTRLSFVQHVTAAASGAKKAAVALGRLMLNVAGPSQFKRGLLMSVVHSRLLYGAQVWADSARAVAKSENALLQTQRAAALRVARCYRTVSDMAALVLA